MWLMPAQALLEVAISQIMMPNAYTSAARDSLPSVSSSGGTAAQPEQQLTHDQHIARKLLSMHTRTRKQYIAPKTAVGL